MSCVTLKSDLSKILFVRLQPWSRPILTPKIKHVGPIFTGSHLRAVTDADDDDDNADNAGRHSTTTKATIISYKCAAVQHYSYHCLVVSGHTDCNLARFSNSTVCASRAQLTTSDLVIFDQTDGRMSIRRGTCDKQITERATICMALCQRHICQSVSGKRLTEKRDDCRAMSQSQSACCAAVVVRTRHASYVQWTVFRYCVECYTCGSALLTRRSMSFVRSPPSSRTCTSRSLGDVVSIIYAGRICTTAEDCVLTLHSVFKCTFTSSSHTVAYSPNICLILRQVDND